MRKHVGQLRAKKLGKPRAVFAFTDDEKKAGKINWLGSIYGLAFGCKRIEGKHDATVDYALLGHFNGDTVDGYQFYSQMCWLPSEAHGEILAAVRTLTDGNCVAFGFRIGTKHSDANEAGYVYATEATYEVVIRDAIVATIATTVVNRQQHGAQARRTKK
jgi:hypothetical protein